MPQNEKKGPKNNLLLKYFFHVIALLLGVLIGIVLCNWSYFIFDREIHLNELVTVIITGAIAVYVGSNIQKAIIRSQNDHEVLFDEIKRIILYIERFDLWVDERRIPFEDGKKFFKKATLSISYCKEIFSENHALNEAAFNSVLNQFNTLKQTVLEISPTGDNIRLTMEQADTFDAMYMKIRTELFKLLVR